MSFSSLPLSYCTNVHPGRSVAEVEEGLDRYTVPVAHAFGRPLSAGLWLARPVVNELLVSEAALMRFADGLRRRNLSCHTLNAFPYGDFHGARVKEQVYLPDWSQPQRLEYTLQCAKVLAALLPAGGEGSISTLPLGFKLLSQTTDFRDTAIAQLIECAEELEKISDTGRIIRLAIEPEPLCLLETTAEAINFFAQLRRRAADVGALEAVQNHLGLCYDVCHQAVEFEDVAESIRALDRASIRINKVHISCALQFDRPSENREGRDALRRYVEPRYLHQTLAKSSNGQIARVVDLSDAVIDHPSEDFQKAPQWRVHFHVPVDAERLGPLQTTRADLKKALETVKQLTYAPHLEVETYTWEVLPGATPSDLVLGLTRELKATDELLRSQEAAGFIPSIASSG